jgi:hypothetical protein
MNKLSIVDKDHHTEQRVIGSSRLQGRRPQRLAA